MRQQPLESVTRSRTALRFAIASARLEIYLPGPDIPVAGLAAATASLVAAPALAAVCAGPASAAAPAPVTNIPGIGNPAGQNCLPPERRLRHRSSAGI